ncbi:hypothetical protein [Pseudoxanthomonas indica]|uniref:Uncharacterized protein n=2 Tax=Pseudoxanthomonas indica TaxID=428993 RepID=A0A1T5LCY8_9GAMM|nr:hypothetical protein [Pseudoxanthomonas indica]GGD33702.1 hypothetical protein GCM10007235_01990 [Pseudoxanthomonas indica]SKC73852.1 hypothetical protein SAMN06296058_2325 [Pseudoxanthomonas indica]
MSNRDVRIDSYFSLPTDLAKEFAAWPEFVLGHAYNVELRSDNEVVVVRLEDDEGKKFVRIRGSGGGPLFHCALGTVMHALSANSDSVFLTRWSDD